MNQEEKKIKALLDSPVLQNQLLGIDLAKSILKWDNTKIGAYVCESSAGWEFEDVPGCLGNEFGFAYIKSFANRYIYLFYRKTFFQEPNGLCSEKKESIVIVCCYGSSILDNKFRFSGAPDPAEENFDYHFENFIKAIERRRNFVEPDKFLLNYDKE